MKSSTDCLEVRGEDMVLLGTALNALAIVIGSWIGLRLKHIPEGIKETVIKAIGLAVIVLGIDMAFKGEQFLFVILSLALGGVLGEVWDLEGKFNSLGKKIELKLKKKADGKIAEGFVAATLLFVVGAMGIIGALDSGLRNDHSVLMTKAVLDGTSSIVFAATMGIGVMFSALAVFLYQGSIALSATLIINWISEVYMDVIINEITAVGGVMIMAIGLNLLGVVKIRVANLLPALLFMILFVVISFIF